MASGRPAHLFEELEHYTTREEFIEVKEQVKNTANLLEKLAPKIEETNKSIVILMSEREGAIKSKDRSYSLWPVLAAGFILPALELMHYLLSLKGH